MVLGGPVAAQEVERGCLEGCWFEPRLILVLIQGLFGQDT